MRKSNVILPDRCGWLAGPTADYKSRCHDYIWGITRPGPDPEYDANAYIWLDGSDFVVDAIHESGAPLDMMVALIDRLVEDGHEHRLAHPASGHDVIIGADRVPGWDESDTPGLICYLVVPGEDDSETVVWIDQNGLGYEDNCIPGWMVMVVMSAWRELGISNARTMDMARKLRAMADAIEGVQIESDAPTDCTVLVAVNVPMPKDRARLVSAGFIECNGSDPNHTGMICRVKA